MIYLIIPAGIFLLDYMVKRRVDKTKELGESEEICDGKIILQKYYNEGATLNLMAKKPKLVTTIHAVILGVLAVGYALILRLKAEGGLKVGLGMMLGGGLSNLYDRITKKHVVDYFSFNVKWKKLKNIIFNISDLFIFLGGIITVIFGKK